MLARIVIIKVELQAVGISDRLRLPRDLQFFFSGLFCEPCIPAKLHSKEGNANFSIAVEDSGLTTAPLLYQADCQFYEPFYKSCFPILYCF